jgi:hypothetical protein
MNMINTVSTAAVTLASAAPSIGSSAMLVELQISQWTGRKKDKRASATVTSQNYADTGTAAVNKKLLGHCEELDAIHKFTANARNIHYSMTMPWSDSGMRLLPTAQYFAYHKQMTELQNEFHSRSAAVRHELRLGDIQSTGTARCLVCAGRLPNTDVTSG